MFSAVLDCRGRPLTLDRPRICGIVNITADSFSDGGLFLDSQAAVTHALQLAEEGADMLDIGAESTRPGASPIPADEQIARIVPAIEAIAAKTQLPISIDTSDPQVMRAALLAGAGMINDVRALRVEGALEVAAETGAVVCLMHMQGEPRVMQEAPYYDDVVGEVHRFLSDRVLACQFAGIDKKRIVIDPGFGFGKTLEHNLLLLAQLERFTEIAPVMAGLSRKSMIAGLTGQTGIDRRVHGSVAAALIAAQHGAAIVRVHDVAATRDALAVWQAVAILPTPARKSKPVPKPGLWDED